MENKMKVSHTPFSMTQQVTFVTDLTSLLINILKYFEIVNI